MKQLVRSRLSGISCTKCDNIIPVGVDRYVNGKMHHCFICPRPEKKKPTLLSRLRLLFTRA